MEVSWTMVGVLARMAILLRAHYQSGKLLSGHAGVGVLSTHSLRAGRSQRPFSKEIDTISWDIKQVEVMC
jgi:hypothetical protein